MDDITTTYSKMTQFPCGFVISHESEDMEWVERVHEAEYQNHICMCLDCAAEIRLGE